MGFRPEGVINNHKTNCVDDSLGPNKRIKYDYEKKEVERLKKEEKRGGRRRKECLIIFL